jgi:hypothetical protein
MPPVQDSFNYREYLQVNTVTLPQGGLMYRIAKTLYSRILPLLFVLVGMAGASDEQFSASSEGLHLGGYSFWQFGQIVKGVDYLDPIDHQWTNNALLGFSLSAHPSERLRLVISPEFYINYPFPESPNKPETVRPFGVSYINEADGIFSFGDLDRPAVELAMGMFSYKYNHDAKHLGEYLFRTGTYPTYVFTDFDFPKVRLLGLKMSSEAISNLHADLLLTSEAIMYPLYDFSLSGIANYTLLNAFEIGAGVDFARLFSVVSKKTSPKLTQTFRPAGFSEYIKENGDTGFYSFKATKVMTRASFDPKVFFGSPEFFGKEDLKFFGEVMWIDPLGGYKEADSTALGYPAYYSDLKRRTLSMFGFNFPAFTLLDIIAVEFEYFPSMLPDDYYKVEQFFVPIPRIDVITEYNPDDYKANTWKWSVYTKRNIINGFSITALFSRDHLRTTYWNGARQSYSCMSTISPLTQNKGGYWHWELKMGYSF